MYMHWKTGSFENYHKILQVEINGNIEKEDLDLNDDNIQEQV